MKIRYSDYDFTYQKLVKKYLKLNPDIEPLVIKVTSMVACIEYTDEDNHWDGNLSDKIPEILAHVSAIWTLQNCSTYFDAEGIED